MDLNELRRPLTVDEVEFRVQSINKGGYATILVYKDARVDQARLDDVCGPLGWKREHTRDNKNCIVSIWDAEKTQWVGKEDTGTESNTEAEKGLASDSFKRACFNWGIGRELYDYPLIQVKLQPKEFRLDNNRAKATYELRLKEWHWRLRHEGGRLCAIQAKDQTGQVRYQWSDNHAKTAKELIKALEEDQPVLPILDEIDNDTQEMIWRYIGSKDRAKLKETIAEERAQ